MKKRRLHKTPAFWILIAVLAFFLYGQFASANATFKKVDTSVVLTAISGEQVDSAVVVDREQLIQVTLKKGIRISGATRIEASYIVGQETQVIDLLKAHQPPQLWDVKVPKTSALMSFIMTIGPIILIALVFLFFMNHLHLPHRRTWSSGCLSTSTWRVNDQIASLCRRRPASDS